jgi:hypothetical protein
MTFSRSAQPYPYLCPQCGCPTHGSVTSLGRRSTYCEDCVGDREIDDLVSDSTEPR